MQFLTSKNYTEQSIPMTPDIHEAETGGSLLQNQPIMTPSPMWATKRDPLLRTKDSV